MATRYRTTLRGMLCAGAAAGALLGTPALAQTGPAPNADANARPPAESDQVGDIIITAQRRAERDVTVPVSITTVTPTLIQGITAGYLTDVGTKVPNVLFTPGTNSPSISIRGVTSQSNINAGFPPAVGVYVDEVYQGRDPTFNTILNDIERVEVLRGPQGTLYGKNTIGGAINIITRDPTNEFGVSGDLTYGNFNLFQARASIGGALIPDQLMIRVSGVHRQRDGYMFDTTTNNDLNDTNADGGRVTVLAHLSDSVRLRLSGDYFTEEGTSALETGPVTLGNVTILNVIPAQNPFDNRVQLNAPENNNRELWGVSGRLEVDLPGVLLTSITAYRGYNSDFNDDSDGLPVDAFTVGREEDGHNFSQELRLSSTGERKVNWILGAYYYDDQTDNFRRIRLGPAMPYLLAGNIAAVVFPNFEEQARTESHIHGRSIAGFGSLTWRITPHISFTGGLRYTYEHKNFSYIQFYTQRYTGLGGSLISNFAVNIPLTRETYSQGEFTGDAALSYFFTPDTQLYLRFSRGFKAGGFQTDVISPPFNASDPLGFDPEFVNNYEIGFKTYLFNRHLRLDLAAFRMDWSDKQEQIFTGLSFLIRNAAQARSEGFEAQLTAQPLPGLLLDANLGYVNARYTSFPGNTLDGRNFPNQPKWTGSFGAQYTFAVTGGLDFYMRGDVNYRSSTFYLPNTTTTVTVPEYATLNGRIGFQSHNGRWGLYAWGRNLTDVRRLGQGSLFPFPNATITTRAPALGATYGAELRFNF